jgi:acid phosphatase (class A)
MPRRLAVTAALILLATGAAVAQTAPPAAPQPSAAKPAPNAAALAPAPVQGYLAPGALDTQQILPEAPVKGTPRYEADRKVFRATRGFKDQPRWKLAQNDAESSLILPDFSCAAGATLTPQTSPKLAALLSKVQRDVRMAVDKPKDFYGRQRPYLIDKGDICVAKTADLAKSPDYPSGHTTWGWTVGLILAEVDPDRATAILVRGRSFGESRIVCGVHNMSAIEAGRTNAAALVAALHGSAQFRADMDGVREELAALRAGPARPDAAVCSTEAGLIAASPF